jgi:hypothetical protein
MDWIQEKKQKVEIDRTFYVDFLDGQNGERPKGNPQISGADGRRARTGMKA